MFWLKQPKVQYVDLLHDFRDAVIGDYHLFDRVWVTETMEHAEKRCPYSRYRDKNPPKEEPIDGVIMETYIDTMYTDLSILEQKPTWEKWENAGYYSSDNKLVFRAKGYLVITKNGRVYAYSVKKNHGEMQEVYDYMDEIEARKKLLIESQERYEAELNGFAAHLEKGKALKKKFFDQI